MKNTCTCLALSLLLTGLLAHISSFGQAVRRPDRIVLHDNTVIEGLISEINETTILYRKAAAPQGTKYQVKKSDVASIRYTNGDEERFDGKGNKPLPGSRSTGVAASSKSKPTATRSAPARPAEPAASGNSPRTRIGLTAGGGGGFFITSGESSDMAMALRGGITAEIPIGSKVALAPSVEYMQLSRTEDKVTVANNYAIATLALASLYNDAKSVNLFYSVGVYGAYGINISGGSESVSFDEAGLNAFHAGGDVKLGARFSQALTVYAQGNYGIMPIQSASTVTIPTVPVTSVTIPATNQVTFGIGLRYLFGK